MDLKRYCRSRVRSPAWSWCALWPCRAAFPLKFGELYIYSAAYRSEAWLLGPSCADRGRWLSPQCFSFSLKPSRRTPAARHVEGWAACCCLQKLSVLHGSPACAHGLQLATLPRAAITLIRCRHLNCFVWVILLLYSVLSFVFLLCSSPLFCSESNLKNYFPFPSHPFSCFL